jgi:4-hydroxybutyrate CoA-transferase
MDKPHHKVSAEEAIRAIKAGDTVYIEGATSEPQTLVEALVDDKERLKGTHLLDSRVLPGSKYAKLTDYFHIITFHVSSELIEGVKSGVVDFLPARLIEIASLFTTSLPIDVALVHVSPPDEKGYCSLGIAAGYNREAALNAKIAIAEVNEQMPFTFGDNAIHVSQLDYLVESSRPLLPWRNPKIGPDEETVARNVSQLIPDGATLCLGIGAIPESLAKALTNKRHLGIHSGMMGDGVSDLMESGVVTNERKSIDKGKTVTAGVSGGEKLVRFVHKNPLVEVHPYSYTHDIMTIRQIENFIAVLSGIEIDLTGQLNAESIGDTQVSAVGGQADWIRGAASAPGGKSIIAFTSMVRGKTSRIVTRLKEGTIVSTPRYDIDYVVTEYGIAELRRKTLSQRAQALISIAHPDFREELERAWRGKD